MRVAGAVFGVVIGFIIAVAVIVGGVALFG